MSRLHNWCITGKGIEAEHGSVEAILPQGGKTHRSEVINLADIGQQWQQEQPIEEMHILAQTQIISDEEGQAEQHSKGQIDQKAKSNLDRQHFTDKNLLLSNIFTGKMLKMHEFTY